MIPYYIQHDTGMSGFYMVNNRSASHEQPGERGLTHLVEHLGCTLVKKLEKDMDRYGIAWNAATSEEWMAFYMTGLSESVEAMLDPFVKAITNFRFSEKEFDRERKVVIQEYEDYFSKQTYSHFMNLLRRRFGYCSAIGYRQDLTKATYEQVLGLAKMLCTPDSAILVGPKPLTIKAELSKKPPVDYPGLFDGYSTESWYDLKEEPIARVDNDSVIMMSKSIREGQAEAKFLSYVLDHGFQSPLNQLLREQHGLVYYASANVESIRGSGLLIISTETAKKNSKKVSDIISSILENPKKYITEKRVEEIREYLRVRRRIAEIKMYDADEILLDDKNVFTVLDTVTTEQLRKICSGCITEPSIDRKDFR